MKTAIQICNWFWWSNRFSMLLLILAVVIAQACVIILGSDRGEALFAVSLSVMATFLAAITIFSFGTNLDLTSGGSAFPKWLFGLPMASWRLALIPVLSMVAALAWAWIPASLVYKSLSPETATVTGMVILPWLGLTAFGTWLQAVAWWPFRYPGLRLLSLGAMAFTIAAVSVVGSVYKMGPNYYSTIILIASASGFVMAVFSAIKARHLTWRSEGDQEGFLQSLGSNRARNPELVNVKKFQSAQSAIGWRDRKQLGKAPLIFMLLMSLPMAIMVISFRTSIYSVFNLFCVPMFIMLMVSPMLGKSRYWKRNYALSTFLSGLPVSDRQFVRARAACILRIAFTTWCVALGVAILWCLSLENRRGSEVAELVEWFSSYNVGKRQALLTVLFTTLYAACVVPWPGLALGLCGRKWLKSVLSVTFFVVGLTVFICFCMQTKNALTLQTMFGGVSNEATLLAIYRSVLTWAWVFFAVKLLATVAMIVLAFQRKVIETPESVRMASIWGVGFAIVLGLFAYLLTPFDFSLTNIALGVFLSFPCASLIAARIGFDWNRHR